MLKLPTQTILVVDDEEGIRDYIRRALTARGHDVVEARDGHAAIHQMEARSFDLAIVDIIMPHKDGIETIIEMRARWPKIRIVAMSGGGMTPPEEFLSLARQVGADGGLSKPIRHSELFRAVAETAEPTALA